MAARKKSTTRKAARKGASAAARFERLTEDLPPTLREFSKQVQKRLGALEKQIEQAQVDARRRAAKLLRTASHQLGRLEALGEGAFGRLTGPARKELIRLLNQLEKAIAPAGKAKKAARSVKPRVKKAVESAAAAASAAGGQS